MCNRNKVGNDFYKYCELKIDQMKKLNVMVLMAIGLLLTVFAFTLIRTGGIQGKVSPAEGAQQVVAVSGTDTLSTELSNGSFMFKDVKPGTYTIWVRANAPYKDSSIENVAVVDSATTDVGEIKLQQ